jgi:hypothetical protein
MLDPIQYEFRFFQNTLADPEPEPEPKLRDSGSGSSQKFGLHAAPASASQHCLEGFQFEAVEASRPCLIKVDEILILHGERSSAKRRGHQCENK